MTDETPPGAPEPTRAAVDIFVLARLGLTLVFVAVTLLLAAPFLSSLTWALVLAVVFLRPHRAIEAVMGRSFGAALSVLIVALIIVGPLAFVSERLINEAVEGAAYIQQEVTQGKWVDFLKAHPWLETVNNWIEGQFDLQDVLSRVGAFLTNAGALFIRQSTGQALTVLLSFYMLFFFLRDRKAGVEALLRLSPFSDIETRKLIVRIRDTIYAIIYGTLAVAALQGALGGFIFWWLNFPSPVFWALIMGLLAIVPVLGTFVVWVPATIFLAIEGRWADALTLGLWGGVVIASSDNLVRPLLISDTLRLHTAPAFIAMLGGIQLFGPSGLVLGPIAMTTTSLMLEFWRRRANA
ncbi:AI-2E family transporter [Methylocystis sp. ATCC 49242]|uniref:AI-2E family transporter n=1 Tax=Methylocystis sp. ATCC 49242 TaxID=622637 RepID=UPI0001F86D02|nr:AI-2E family transporter [Methylocystis sp. ATCC 49242]